MSRLAAPRWRVHLCGTLQRLGEFMRRHPPGCEQVRLDVEANVAEVELTLDERQLALARHLGLKIRSLYNASARDLEQRRWVGRGNRFSEGRIPPGVGVPKARSSS